MRPGIRQGRLELVRTSAADAAMLVARLADNGFSAHVEGVGAEEEPAEAPSGTGPAPGSLGGVVGELERLAALMEKGFLTSDELAAQKARLLGPSG